MCFSKVNNRGFSLIEVMIVSSLMMIVSLGAAKFISSQGKQISYLEDRLSKTQLTQEMMDIFNERELCLKILGAVKIKKEKDPVSIKIENDVGRIYFDPQSQNNIYDQLQITNAQVINQSVKGPNSVGEVEIQIWLKRLREKDTGAQITPITFNIPVVITNNYNVKSCFPKRAPICGDSVLLKTGKMFNPSKDFTNCCPGGGALSDCVTTGLEQTPLGSSIFYICTCE